jgi:UDP-N-acetylglucosamine 2-epimerase (non-hydrolysing)
MTDRPFVLVAGTRPNLVKLAPLAVELRRRNTLPFRIVHTGQHYDDELSANFFRVLGIPLPDENLEVGAGRPGAQTARILERFEDLLLRQAFAAVVVFGDVTSTMACALAAAKQAIPVVHVEAGLRSFDRSMPEEINRVVTDAIADLLLVSEPAGMENLAREGIDARRVNLVGNLMIDSLDRSIGEAVDRRSYERHGLARREYAFLTMHRPSNVDDPETLRRLLTLFDGISERMPVLFAVHPRTRERIDALRYQQRESSRFKLVGPVDYVDSLSLQEAAAVVFTDSGGMQEETAALRVPCLTLRFNTERPITVERGTSTLVGNEPRRIRAQFQRVLDGTYGAGRGIDLWDGGAAGRIADVLEAFACQGTEPEGSSAGATR